MAPPLVFFTRSNHHEPMNQTDSPILRSDQDHVASLTLNRPARMNAMSVELLEALSRELDVIGADKNVRVVIIQGAGKVFSAGHDLKELLELEESAPSCQSAFNACTDVMVKIQKLPQPVIARVHGIATAAGCQLVAACDLAIASDSTRFATSGINLGLFCATPLVQLSRAIGKSAALEMTLTGRFINADEAARIGLISRAVGEDILDAEVENLALEIASKSPTAITMGKELFYKQRHLDLEAAYTLAGETMHHNMQQSETREGIKAFVEKRAAPEWKNRE